MNNVVISFKQIQTFVLIDMTGSAPSSEETTPGSEPVDTTTVFEVETTTVVVEKTTKPVETTPGI